MAHDVVQFSDDAGRQLFWHTRNLNTETLQLIVERTARILEMRLPLFVAESEEVARAGPPLRLEASFFPDPALKIIHDAAKAEIDSRKFRVLNANLCDFTTDELRAFRDRVSNVLDGRRLAGKRK